MAVANGIPAGLLFASLLGSMLGLGWHALFGRRLWQLPLYWLGGILGFWGGLVGSSLTGLAVYRVGTVPVLEGSSGALFVLGLVWLVTTPAEPPRVRRPRRRSRRGADGSTGKG
ncbi:hypothetical protein OO015_04230 [Thermomicrobium sp. 4228-Ro]|uniref:hypothetical protein n=1 Tax=Thermomicrobium sp. 4228-Ro TaxID=2993937 RepID=UPI0022490A0A|nr:hypothetical protein [Thermomicrobium sp. 4228-Ro]MCX2726700.1 hypothetical protein [Thermomicrobium sp. 4228-Ro]